MTPVAAVVFDFDGLILDTETPIYESWREAYRENDRDLDLDVWQRALGTHAAFDPCGHLAELLGRPVDCDALRRQVQARNLRRCDEQPLLPGVAERAEEARALGLRTAVASSSTCRWVDGWLTRHGIRPLFDSVCARDDVARVKPAPDLYLLAAERLGVAPAACLVFEDSPNGILAARAAGMRVAAVPNVLTRLLELPETDLVLGSLAEMSLAEMFGRLRGRPALAPSP